jgi:hypothetical protein
MNNPSKYGMSYSHFHFQNIVFFNHRLKAFVICLFYEGFKEGKMGCCGTGPYRGIPSCGGKRSVKEYELCGNASEYLFFDSAHPSERANQQLAKLLWNGNLDVTWPYNLKALFENK